ncbi:MAG: Enoyl-CoA hydratase, partial [uncultured Ramlibacter sp.]
GLRALQHTRHHPPRSRRFRARHPDARAERQAADGRARRPPRAGRDLARRRRRRQRALRRAARRGPGLLRRRRPGAGAGHGFRLRGAQQGVEGGPRPGLQRDQLRQAHRQRIARTGRGGRAGGRPVGRHPDRRPEREDRRRPHPAGRRRRRPCRDRLAAAVRHGQGQVLPAAVRAGQRRGGRAHRPGGTGRGRQRAAAQGLRDRGSPRKRQPERHPLDQVLVEQLAAPGRARFRHFPGAGIHGVRWPRRARRRGLAARAQGAPFPGRL